MIEVSKFHSGRNTLAQIVKIEKSKLILDNIDIAF